MWTKVYLKSLSAWSFLFYQKISYNGQYEQREKGKETENQIEEKEARSRSQCVILWNLFSGREILTTGMVSLFHRKQC